MCGEKNSLIVGGEGALPPNQIKDLFEGTASLPNRRFV